MNYQKEFLQLQGNQIVDVSFKFPTGLKKEGQYGPYFLYTIVHEGKEKFLKVTERLEKELRKMNISTKQAYSLFKEVVNPAKGEPFTVLRIVEANPSQPASTTTPQQPAESRPAAGQQTTFAGDKQVMHQSMLDAVDITKAISGVDWRNTDIEKIGVSLFLSRTGQLSTESILSNGNGGVKKSRKNKVAVEPPRPEEAHALVPAEEVPANGNGKHDDLPF